MIRFNNSTTSPLPSLALADLEIASIAIANELTLVSGNLRHFTRVEELKVENWLEYGDKGT